MVDTNHGDPPLLHSQCSFPDLHALALMLIKLCFCKKQSAQEASSSICAVLEPGTCQKQCGAWTEKSQMVSCSRVYGEEEESLDIRIGRNAIHIVLTPEYHDNVWWRPWK